jgi:signal transduction histidine kinase
MPGRFARRFAARGAAEAALLTALWLVIGVVFPPRVLRGPAVVTALAAGATFALVVCGLRWVLGQKLRDPARLQDVSLFTSAVAALAAMAIGWARHGLIAALLAVGPVPAASLLLQRTSRHLAPASMTAGPGIRLRDHLASATFALALAGWATIAAVLLGGEAALGLPAGATDLARLGGLFGLAFLLFAISVAAAAGRAVGRQVDRVAGAVEEMAESTRLGQALPVLAADELGDLTSALGELRTHLAAELDTYQHALDRARQAAQRKDDFLALLARELRAPLESIASEVQTVASAEPAQKTPAQKEDLRIIEASARQLLGMLDDVVGMSVLESGALKLAKIDLDAAELCREVVRELGGILVAQSKSIELLADAPEPLPVHADRQRLRQVLTNLVGNAIKFTDHGHVVVRARRGDAGVEIAVSDTGRGIAEDLLPHVFDAYRQAAGGEGPSKGHGLGLAIARRLVELHGGTVRVDSTPQVGSTFALTLPMGEP